MDDPAARAAQARLRVKIASDVFIWTFACLVAFVLRAPSHWIEFAPVMAAYALASALLKFSLILKFRLYRQVWRHVTVEDVRGLASVVAIGSGVMFVVGLGWSAAGISFPRTVPIIEGVLALLGMAAVRIAVRMWAARKVSARAALGGTPRRVVLVGAGEAGTHIGWEIQRRPASGLVLIGFLDDNLAKAQLSIAGASVLGRVEDLPRLAHQHRIDEVFITMPSGDGRQTRHIAELARQAEVACRILPGITQVLSGDVTLAGVRPVQVEDLLRREPIEFDLPTTYIEGKTILVTGAGGSIGSELVRQAALLEPANIILFGHGETALHRIHEELLFSVPGQRTTVVIGDVRDRAKIDLVMRKFQPSIVFHAAAHKHVPLMEADPDEAVLNNVGGTRNLAAAALQAGVERFVNVSTDKAVRPTSILGATKSLAELVVRAVAGEADEGQSFVSVRFGNVLGSRGSVVEAFQEQIRRGGPVRLTDPEMSRYFMTIREASQLVIQSGALGGNGAVYVLDMGIPVRILNLARDMIHLAGMDDDEIQIVFTGRRPGEKLHEELFGDEESLEVTRFSGISVAHREQSVDKWTPGNIDQLVAAAERRDFPELDRYLGILLNGFRPVATVPSIMPEGVRTTLPTLQEQR